MKAHSSSFKLVQFVFRTDLNWPSYNGLNGYKCGKTSKIYIILLYPDERRPTTVRSNDTLVDTPFQLISGFFHVNQGILCSEHAEQASSRGVLERGGGQQPEVD